MKAQVVEKYGESSIFVLKKLPIPEPREDEVLVKVKATSINPLDISSRKGLVPNLVGDLPAILHADGSGVVEKAGENVKNFKKGDEVYFCFGGIKPNQGSLREYTIVDQKSLAKKPHHLSHEEAAAIPLVGITAYEGLVIKGALKKDQTVLIQGAAGGIGHIAVQIAKALGALVSATVINEKESEYLKSLGVENIIMAKEESAKEYTKRITNGNGFDLVFDTVGGQNMLNSFEAAKINGTVVTVSAQESINLSLAHAKALDIKVVFMLIPLIRNIGRELHGEILQKLSELADFGKLKPLVDKVFEF
ncbi:MAG: NADPH:quinone reductase, partial [Campylobacterota bacterium]|nr:NADPH:quinone reductase [Campylobacterota bacterium]